MEGERNEISLPQSEKVKIHLHYLDHFFRVEQNEGLQSEQKIKFFLALTAGIITVYSLLANFNVSTTSTSKIPDNDSLMILAFLILFLCILGLFVFASIIWSDRKIKQYRYLWRISYNKIKSLYPEANCYDEEINKTREEGISKPFLMFKGTLTQIMWFIEGVLFAVFMFVLCIAIGCELICVGIMVLISTSFVLLLLWNWIRYIKKGIN